MRFTLLFIFVFTLFAQLMASRVTIPDGCAGACPEGGAAVCGRNKVTKKLGSFENECVFGRYNNCHKTTESKLFYRVLWRRNFMSLCNFRI